MEITETQCGSVIWDRFDPDSCYEMEWSFGIENLPPVYQIHVPSSLLRFSGDESITEGDQCPANVERGLKIPLGPAAHDFPENLSNAEGTWI